MIRWRYRHAGLSVDSAVEIPDWAAFAIPAAAEADVTVNLAAFDPASPDTDRVEDEGRVIWIGGPAIARFRVVGGRTITVHPLPGVAHRQWLPFLLGSAWNALCLQRGLLLLHASVVGGPDGAYAFCGPSGAGKSTTAARLMRRDLVLLSDDLCRVDPGQPALVHPSAPRLRLWADAVLALGNDPATLTRVLDGRDKYLLPADGRAEIAPIPLRGIFLLEWGAPRVERLTGLTGLSRLVRDATFRPWMIDAMGLTARHWEQCLALLRSVPLYLFRRPQDPASLHTATDLDHPPWHDL